MKRKIDNKLSDAILKKAYGSDITELKSYITSQNIDDKDKDGRTLLFHAILAKNDELVSFLIKNGAECNLRDNIGWYPLHYSAQNYLIKITEMLINKSDINVKDSYGNSVIWRAVFASQGRGEIIKLLLANGADPSLKNNSNVSALDLANTIANHDVKQYFN